MPPQIRSTKDSIRKLPRLWVLPVVNSYPEGAEEELKHGTRSMFINRKCRCAPCRAANAIYSANWIAKKRAGNGAHLRPAEKSRLHLIDLQDHGLGLRAVSDATDVSVDTIRNIREGISTRVRGRTERKILNTTPDAVANSALIPSRKVRAMIRKLKTEGFTLKLVAERAGLHPEAVQKIVKRKRNVRATTQMKIEKLFNRIMAA